MRKLIEVAGDIAGGAGLLVCLISGGARVTGQFYLLGYEARKGKERGQASNVA